MSAQWLESSSWSAVEYTYYGQVTFSALGLFRSGKIMPHVLLLIDGR